MRSGSDFRWGGGDLPVEMNDGRAVQWRRALLSDPYQRTALTELVSHARQARDWVRLALLQARRFAIAESSAQRAEIALELARVEHYELYNPVSAREWIATGLAAAPEATELYELLAQFAREQDNPPLLLEQLEHVIRIQRRSDARRSADRGRLAARPAPRAAAGAGLPPARDVARARAHRGRRRADRAAREARTPRRSRRRARAPDRAHGQRERARAAPHASGRAARVESSSIPRPPSMHSTARPRSTRVFRAWRRRSRACAPRSRAAATATAATRELPARSPPTSAKRS